MSRRGSGLALAMLLGLLALPDAAGAAVRPVYGGSARIGAEGPLTQTDPARARSDAERLLARATSCTVADAVAAVEVHGDDARRVRLRLHDNLTFHDGTRLLAADVARSLERVAALGAQSPAGWRLLVLDRAPGGEGRLAVEATGPLSLEVGLAAPVLDVLAWLDDPGLAILRADGRTGCGPYRPAETQAGTEVHLRPFDRHVAGRPYLDELILVTVAPGAAAAPELADVDGAVGTLAGREGRALDGGQLVVLRLEGRHRADAALRRRLSAAVDREGLVRFLLGGRGQALAGLSDLVGGDGQPTADGGPETALPGRLLIGYDAHHPLRRRLAERIQVRLHDLGTRVVLAPVDGRGPSGADLALEVVTDLPADPALALLALAHRAGDAAVAREVLAAILGAGDDAAALIAIAEGLEARLGLVPLYFEPGRMRLHPDLLLGATASDEAFDPAELWRWPAGIPRAGGAGPGGF
jgi:hypothetical protein